MAIPLKYNIGNLTSRRVATLLTILGIGVVNAVLVSMLALYRGVQITTVSSGSPQNLIALRDGAETELSSWFSRDKFAVMRSLPGIAKNSKGEALISPELMMLFKLPKRGGGKASNVEVRALTPVGIEMRPQLRIVEGRMFHPNLNEVIVARRIRDRFEGTNVGDTFHFGAQDYHVVGVFDAGGTAFDSEIWADLNYIASARQRTGSYSSVLMTTESPDAFKSLKSTIEDDNRLKLMAKSERTYYAEQTKGLAGVIILVGFVVTFMTGAAILGTMNTMFTTIATRKRELATMRALGFKRRAVLFSMMAESALISLLGGVAGLILALPVNGISTGTTNFRTFSEVAFNFHVDTHIAIISLTIALVAGVIGGLLPALNAARLPITRALREI